MKFHKFVNLVFVTVVTAVFAGCGASDNRTSSLKIHNNDMPPAVDQALCDSTSFVLFSLNPDPRAEPTEGKRFHEWNVLGETVVSDSSTRDKLIAALKAGMAENDGTVADCFNPRHGVRVTDDGKTHEFAICFECYQIYWYADGKMVETLLVTGSPQPKFDQVLKDANVPLANKP